LPFDFAALERARQARDPRDLTAPVALPPQHVQIGQRTGGFRRTDFAAGKEYEDGRFVPTHLNLTRDTAEAVAGRLRDESSDADVKRQLDEHWTWAYRMQRGNGATNAPRKRQGGWFTKRSARPTP
jgi:hypothetical protein